MSDEKQKRLNLLRYGLFVVVVVAFVLTPSWLYIATGGGIVTSEFGSVTQLILLTIINTVIVGALAAGIYMLYKRVLMNS